MKNKQGAVYVLTNPSMPEIIKIEATQDSVKNRCKTISKATGVPTPFEVEYECTVSDCYKVEKALHAAFSPWRVNDNREFFRVNAAQVIAILQLVQIENTTEIATADQTEAKRNPRFTFSDMKIPIGATLVFWQDEEIKAVVTKSNKVVYKGQEQSLSALTRDLIGYIVRPLQYWSYEGRNLLEVYEEVYNRK